MSRATAVQALIDRMAKYAAHETLYRDAAVGRQVQEWADELAALLPREGPQDERRYCPRCSWEGPASQFPIPQYAAGLREGPPAPPGSAGDAVQEAMPDHCENCRAELPVTTVHLCHACLPSAPREHAGDAPATEPAYKLKLYRCKVCGTRWLLWPEPLTTGGWNLLDHWQRPDSCCDNAAMGDQIEHLRDIPLAASQAGTAPRALMHYRITHTFRSGCGMTAVNGIHWTTDISYVSCADCQAAAHGAVPPQEQK